MSEKSEAILVKTKDGRILTLLCGISKQEMETPDCMWVNKNLLGQYNTYYKTDNYYMFKYVEDSTLKKANAVLLQMPEFIKNNKFITLFNAPRSRYVIVNTSEILEMYII